MSVYGHWDTSGTDVKIGELMSVMWIANKIWISHFRFDHYKSRTRSTQQYLYVLVAEYEQLSFINWKDLPFQISEAVRTIQQESPLIIFIVE